MAMPRPASERMAIEPSTILGMCTSHLKIKLGFINLELEFNSNTTTLKLIGCKLITYKRPKTK